MMWPAGAGPAETGTDVELETLRRHCLAKPGAEASHPFGPDALVMKVAGKIFAIVAEHARPPTVSLKCDPDVAATLRASYPAVTPGYHLNKRHWITVCLDGTVTDGEIRDWVDDSYDLVVDGLPRHVQRRLGWDPAPEVGGG